MTKCFVPDPPKDDTFGETTEKLVEAVTELGICAARHNSLVDFIQETYEH